jgi:hypothetical protein
MERTITRDQVDDPGVAAALFDRVVQLEAENTALRSAVQQLGTVVAASRAIADASGVQLVIAAATPRTCKEQHGN